MCYFLSQLIFQSHDYCKYSLALGTIYSLDTYLGVRGAGLWLVNIRGIKSGNVS